MSLYSLYSNIKPADLKKFLDCAKLCELPIAELQAMSDSIDDFVVGALIVNNDGKIFAQKRSPSRKLFPGCWDIAGGHMEKDETITAALKREIAEETGWTLARIQAPVAIFDWFSESAGARRRKREFDFLVETTGDLLAPRLETDKCSEWHWFGPQDVERLKENRNPDDTIIHDIILSALTGKL